MTASWPAFLCLLGVRLVMWRVGARCGRRRRRAQARQGGKEIQSRGQQRYGVGVVMGDWGVLGWNALIFAELTLHHT